MHRLALLLTLFVALFAVAGCGDDDSGSDSTSAAAVESGAFPVTVQHRYGSTTIESEPKRVVTVGLRDQEPLLALGVEAVGAMDWFGQGTYGKWAWEKDLWGGDPPPIVSSDNFEVNIEKVAAQRPDLILAIYQDLDKEEYARLSKIAPVIADDKAHKPYTMPWRDETRVIGKAVGREEQAEAKIKEVEAMFAKVRKEHPEFKGKEAMIVDPGEGEPYAFSSTDPRGQFLAEMGFESSERADKISKDGYGAEISGERLDLLDVDYLFLLIDAKAKKRVYGNPLFKQLDVVKEGRVVELPYYDQPQYGAAVAFNTVLSKPYAIEGALKQIAKARTPPA